MTELDAAPEGLHVVLGAGAIGLAVVDELVGFGGRVRLVSRSGGTHPAEGVEVVAADLSDPGEARRATEGGAVVYHAANPPYQDWARLFPAIHTSIIAATARAGARLVMADNLYMYGRPDGRPMTEDRTPVPASARGELRARLTAEALAAHHRGDVEVAIARASDYFGPRGLASHMGERVFGRLLAGRKAQVMGDPNTLHTYTYLPDIAGALVTLGSDDGATGQVWHVPSPPAITTNQFVQLVCTEIGREPAVGVMPPALLGALAVFSPLLRAVRAELYQLTGDWIMDDQKFRTAFGVGATPLPEAITATVNWYRSRA